ncbi:magnesium transporter NIPA-domain-containing protein [Apodospora peruviana]|uniref:Magnesium transporter NIPA-domain-containing protein n=1 Tax=Apodospora peruviana TaxID=516989 RepID=A0AAE0HVA6_9PEZI|nr:magnesium transporter NIPA-domain-containing protein [Apodospora peruviana]
MHLPLADNDLPDHGGGSGGHGHDGDKDQLQNWSSLIGIITAICGNVLIALALNVQRYAHIRLHRRRARNRERAKQAMKNAATHQGYGTANTPDGDLPPSAIARRNSARPEETEPLTARRGDSFGSTASGDESVYYSAEDDDSNSKAAGSSSSYLKDPYWWSGQVLITVGEMGNFLAYGFAPASIVSPLGVVALVSNCVIAPIFFKEVFRRRDFFGVIVAVAGAVTVVLSAKQEETKLGPHEVWDAITTTEFEIYVGVSCALIALLMWLSPRYGNRTILIDLGLVGLFGGYTALSTKGVSSMLSSTLFGAFTTPVTYALLFVLLSTAVMQVRYVNKALQRFDSTQVIPIQFVLFTLCVIIGSAVLYRDFERTTREQAVKFVGGCLLTFFGVFLITSGRPRQDPEEDTLSDAEGIEETIGLSEQSPGTPQAPHRRGSDAVRSRRSSRASRVSFKESAVNRPLAILAGTGYPSKRVPPAKGASLAEEESENSPLLDSIWREAPPQDQQQHPGLGPHTISSDSVISTPISDGELQQSTAASTTPVQPTLHIPQTNNIHHSATSGTTITPATERPVTPRAPASGSRPHSHHFSGPMFTPSPFSSTVSAVVADKILAHLDSSSSSPTTRRMITARRSRPGLRNSLFVPSDEVVEDYETDQDSDEESDLLARAQSAVEATGSLFGEGGATGGEQERKGGFRGRARSLSHTLGELFGVSSGGNGNGKRKKMGSRRTTGTMTTTASDLEDDDRIAAVRAVRAEDGRLINVAADRTRPTQTPQDSKNSNLTHPTATCPSYTSTPRRKQQPFATRVERTCSSIYMQPYTH